MPCRDCSSRPTRSQLTRRLLPADKGLIGFVGGPWTLFVYAMEGSHAGAMRVAKSSLAALSPVRRAGCCRCIGANIAQQLEAGADVVMVLDTAAGELPPAYFDMDVAPGLIELARAFPGRVGYYAKAAHPSLYTPAMAAAPWGGVGIDSRWNLAAALAQPGRKGFVQGNFDPAWLFLPHDDLVAAIAQFLAPIRALDAHRRRGWICGLGHGVLPGTPESAVRTFVAAVGETFA